MAAAATTLIPPCRLEPSGYCPLCRRVHVGASLELALDPGERGAAYRQRQRDQVSKGLYGPGTELEKMLADTPDAAAVAPAICGCAKRVKQMNVWGVGICRAQRERIVAWFVKPCGEKPEPVLTEAIRDIVGGLVDEAINRADAKCRAVPVLSERKKEPRPPRERKRKAKGCCGEEAKQGTG